MIEEVICPDCGRKKSKGGMDSLKGYCPKWWAICDNAAYEDCLHYQQIMLLKVQLKDIVKSTLEVRVTTLKHLIAIADYYTVLLENTTKE